MLYSVTYLLLLILTKSHKGSMNPKIHCIYDGYRYPGITNFFGPFRDILRRLMDLKISLNTLNKLLQYKCYNFDKITSGGHKVGINTKVHGT